MNIHKSQLFWCEQKRGTIGFDTLPTSNKWDWPNRNSETVWNSSIFFKKDTGHISDYISHKSTGWYLVNKWSDLSLRCHGARFSVGSLHGGDLKKPMDWCVGKWRPVSPWFVHPRWSGWWFGNVIIPTGWTPSFFRGVGWNHQPVKVLVQMFPPFWNILGIVWKSLRSDLIVSSDQGLFDLARHIYQVVPAGPSLL